MLQVPLKSIVSACLANPTPSQTQARDRLFDTLHELVNRVTWYGASELLLTGLPFR